MRNDTPKLGLYTAWGDTTVLLRHNAAIEEMLAPEDRDTLRTTTPLQLLALGCDAAESARSHAEASYRPGTTDHDRALSLEISVKATDYVRAILSELARRVEVNS
jgi:hypothetical protein